MTAPVKPQPTATTRSVEPGGPTLGRSRVSMRRVLPAVVIWVAVVVVVTVVSGRPVLGLALAMALGGLLIADRPPLATLVAVGLLYSNAVVVATTHHGVPGVAAAVVPLLLAVAIAHRLIVRREPLVLPVATPWVAALLLVQLFGTLASRQPQSALAGVGVFLSEGLVLFVLVSVATQGARILRQAALVLVLVATALSALSLTQRLTGSEKDDYLGFAQVSDAVVARDDLTGEGEARHAGPIGEKNRWGQTLAVVLPLALALAATDRSSWGRAVGAVGAVAIVAGIVLTYSRGAAVGLVLAGLIATGLRWIPRRAALVGALVFAVGLMALAPVYVTRASTVVEAGAAATGEPAAVEDGSGADGSFTNRAVEAAAAFAVFVHHPLVGVGPGEFPTYFQDEARRMGADRIVGVEREAHNLYLGLAAEMGVLGLIAFIGVVAAVLAPLAATRRAHKDHRPDISGLATGFAAALVVYLTTGLFLHFAYIRYFWLIAALAAAMGLVRESTSRAVPNEPAVGRSPKGDHHVHP